MESRLALAPTLQQNEDWLSSVQACFWSHFHLGIKLQKTRLLDNDRGDLDQEDQDQENHDQYRSRIKTRPWTKQVHDQYRSKQDHDQKRTMTEQE